MKTEAEIQAGCSDLVRREVYCCASYLIRDFAQGFGEVGKACPDLMETCEQAFELSCPIIDWKEAATEAGFVVSPDPDLDNDAFLWKATDNSVACDCSLDTEEAAWRACCDENHIEPDQREIFEHWIVSSWLGRKLQERGEKVDFDFCNLTIWARTTTGQAISLDFVIREIWQSIQTKEIG